MNNDIPVPIAVCDAKMSLHDERFRRDKERLDKLDEIIARLSESNALLTQMVAGHDKNIEVHNKHIRALENKPSALWDKLVGAVIAAIAGGLAAALMSLVV